MWSLAMVGGAGGRIPASSPLFLAGELAGEELGFARGRFVPKLKVKKDGSERDRWRWRAVAAAAGHPVKGRRIQGTSGLERSSGS
jgi:hypothetical protein